MRFWKYFGCLLVTIAVCTACGDSRTTDGRQSGSTTAVPVATIAMGSSPFDLLPPQFKPSTAGAFFTGNGTAEEVAHRFLNDRLHSASSSALPVTVQSAVPLQDQGVVMARWSREEPSDGRKPGAPTAPRLGGDVILRRDGETWQIVAATSAGVDLSGVRREANRIVGIVRVSEPMLAFSADVLDLAGRPVPSSPFPNGVPGAAYLYAAAARSNGPQMTLDIAVPDAPVTIRIHAVGGLLLTISEIHLDANQH